jgi:Tfp pilus assembly protein FimV
VFQQQLAERQQQQQMLQQQLAERQKQSEDAQRQLMIGLQQREKQPTEVRMAASGAEQQGLTRRGTSGYFGRRGMRISSLNVPSTGLAIAPSNQMSTSGSFA